MSSRFRVVKILKMEDSVMTGRTLGEALTWRETDRIYKPLQGKKRRGSEGIQGTPSLIRQDDENFVEI